MTRTAYFSREAPPAVVQRLLVAYCDLLDAARRERAAMSAAGAPLLDRRQPGAG